MNQKQRECRFCLEKDTEDKLLCPCNCRGTMGGVHHECIKTWLKQKGARKCEVCNTKLKVKAVYPSFRIIMVALTKTLWIDKRKLLRMLIFAVYSKFMYNKLLLVRSGICLLADKHRKNWLCIFGIGALLGFCYSQFMLAYIREIRAAIIEIIKVVRATAEITISNY